MQQGTIQRPISSKMIDRSFFRVKDATRTPSNINQALGSLMELYCYPNMESMDLPAKVELFHIFY